MPLGCRPFCFDSWWCLCLLKMRLIWLDFSVWQHAWFADRRRVSARHADLLSGVPESRQRTRPLLPTTLRFAAGNLRRQALGAVRQNSLRVFDAPFKHVAVKVITMQLHSAVQLPAPRACRHRRGHKGQYRVREQNSFSINFDSCYRNRCMDFKPISSQISQAVRSLPSVCACGTRFRLWATLR